MGKKILKAEYQGKLNIGGIQISCSVLEDGTRILVERSVANAFGVKGSGSHWEKKRKLKKGAFLPEYVSAKYLEPYIKKDVYKKLSEPIIFISNKRQLRGIPASALPDICDIWVSAKEGGALNKIQSHVAQNAYILLRGFAHVGIIALVDEVTGYQYDRDRQELNKILEAYIAPELMPWQRRFPDEFYKEIFRLNNWSYNPLTVKRPQVIGHWTNTLIYKQLPPGVLNELKKRTPKDVKGRRKYHYHRLLTEDIGDPHLEKQIAAIIPIMRLSTTWRKFKENFARAFKVGQQILDLEEENED